MKIVNSCIIAFAMYSKIPMPRVEWSKKNMEYAMCFFPWVGAVIGALFYLWGYYGTLLPIGNTLHKIILLFIPIVITGGIHLDGLLDTSDALSSYQPMERRLEILKDSNAGAFAIIICVSYYFLYFALLSELKPEGTILAAMGFFLSRTLSGLSITRFRCAKDSGLASTFSSNANKRKVGRLLFGQGLVCAIVMIYLNPLVGGITVLTAVLCFFYYRYMAYKKFGGITGDLAGWFLQICEIAMLLTIIVMGIII